MLHAGLRLIGVLGLALCAGADTVLITVRDEAGAPIEGANIRESLGQHVSDATGQILIEGLPEDEVSVAFSMGHPDFVPQPVSLEFEQGVSHYEVAVVMPRGKTLAGTVVDAAGASVAGAQVRTQVPPPRSIMVELSQKTVSGTDGTFELRGAQAGEDGLVKLSVFKKGYRRDSHTVDSNAPGARELRLEIVPEGSGPQVEGRVAFASGRPPERGRLRFVSTGDCFQYATRNIDVDPDGGFSFPLPEEGCRTGFMIYEATQAAAGIPGHPEVLLPDEVVKAHWAWQSSELTLHANAPVVVNFIDIASVRIEVTPPPALPEAEVIQLIVSRRDRVELPAFSKTIASQDFGTHGGELVLDRLTPGEYFARVLIQDAPSLVWGKPFHLDADSPASLRLNFALPAIPHTQVHGRVTRAEDGRPAAGGTIRLQGRGVDRSAPIVNGTYQFDDVFPARILLTATSADGALQGRVRSVLEPIADNTAPEIRLRPLPPTGESCRGTIHFEDGSPVNGAGTRTLSFRPSKTRGTFESRIEGDPPYIAFDLYGVRGWPRAASLRQEFFDPFSSGSIGFGNHEVSCVAYVPAHHLDEDAAVVLRRTPARTLRVKVIPDDAPDAEKASMQVFAGRLYPPWILTLSTPEYRLQYLGSGIARDNPRHLAHWDSEDSFVIEDIPPGSGFFAYHDAQWAGTFALPDTPGEIVVDLAELPTGTVAGTVHDAAGAPFDGLVEITDSDVTQAIWIYPGPEMPEAKPLFKTLTEAHGGHFRFPRLTPGTYTVSVHGFYQHAEESIVVRAGEGVEVALNLRQETEVPGLPLRDE